MECPPPLMERHSVSMLCASSPDVALKHHGNVTATCFGAFCIALQHEQCLPWQCSKLNYRYFFITHCPVRCCRNGTVRPAPALAHSRRTFCIARQWAKL